MTYKWTIAEVDAVEMPMIFCLMDEIGEMPPQDFLANAQIAAMKQRAEREKLGAVAQFKPTPGKVRRRNDGN